MRVALNLLVCLALLTIGLTEGHKKSHGKHGPGHSLKQDSQQNGENNSQQQESGKPQQQESGNPQQQGTGNTQQQESGKPQQQGAGNSEQQGSQNPPQGGSQNPQNGRDGAMTMEERALDDMINQLKERLEHLSGAAGDKIRDAMKSSSEASGKLRGRMDLLMKKLRDRKKDKAEKQDDKDDEEEELGSGDIDDMFNGPINKTAVTTDEVKMLLGDIAALADKVDVPLEAIKSDLVDKMSHIKDAQDLALFLRNEASQFQLPIQDFRKMIKSAQRMMTRLFLGYEKDPSCDDFRKDLRKMVPESGELPETFHAEFLQQYLMSVSCMATDNALFKTDLAMLQELDEGSSRDEVLAAITKALVGSIRLMNKMVEQSRALRFAMYKLPEPGVPDDAIVYKRLI